MLPVLHDPTSSAPSTLRFSDAPSIRTSRSHHYRCSKTTTSRRPMITHQNRRRRPSAVLRAIQCTIPGDLPMTIRQHPLLLLDPRPQNTMGPRELGLPLKAIRVAPCSASHPCLSLATTSPSLSSRPTMAHPPIILVTVLRRGTIMESVANVCTALKGIRPTLWLLDLAHSPSLSKASYASALDYRLFLSSFKRYILPPRSHIERLICLKVTIHRCSASVLDSITSLLLPSVTRSDWDVSYSDPKRHHSRRVHSLHVAISNAYWRPGSHEKRPSCGHLAS
jgi:hypothetical protein